MERVENGIVLETCTRCFGRGYQPESRGDGSRPGFYARNCPGCGGRGERPVRLRKDGKPYGTPAEPRPVRLRKLDGRPFGSRKLLELWAKPSGGYWEEIDRETDEGASYSEARDNRRYLLREYRMSFGEGWEFRWKEPSRKRS